MRDRISSQSKLDTAFLIQNNRKGKASQTQENKVLSFQPVDKELSRAYNEQFPYSFKYFENAGQKKFRNFLIAQDLQTLEQKYKQVSAFKITKKNIKTKMKN